MLKTFTSQLNQVNLWLPGIFREKQLLDNSKYKTKACTHVHTKLNIIKPASEAPLAQEIDVLEAGRTSKSRTHEWQRIETILLQKYGLKRALRQGSPVPSMTEHLILVKERIRKIVCSPFLFPLLTCLASLISYLYQCHWLYWRFEASGTPIQLQVGSQNTYDGGTPCAREGCRKGKDI